jgi:hypothetical protein
MVRFIEGRTAMSYRSMLTCLVIAFLAVAGLSAVLGAELRRPPATSFCLDDNTNGTCAADTNFNFYWRRR